MNFITQKLNNIRSSLFSKGLYDVRLLALAFVAFIAVSVFWNGAKIIQQNYDLSVKVQEIQRQSEIIELENRNKELQNQYLATDTFAELTARRVNGQGAPGERVYIVPEETALSALSERLPEEVAVEVTEKPKYQKNLEAWVSIYFGS